jgi:hypothetical protein
MKREPANQLAREFAAIVQEGFMHVLGREERVHVGIGHGTVGDSFMPNGKMILSVNTSAFPSMPSPDDLKRVLAHLQDQCPLIELERYSFRLTVPRGQETLPTARQPHPA